MSKQDFESITATEAKVNFWSFLDRVQRWPVLINKNKRDVAITFSLEDAEDLILWAEAYKAEKEWMLWTDATEHFLNKFRIY